MDYLADRVRKLITEAEDIEWEAGYKTFIKKMIEVLEDCALVADDLVDAVDEIDMRLSELEDRFKDGDGPE
jgi:hypothetical protein